MTRPETFHATCIWQQAALVTIIAIQYDCGAADVQQDDVVLRITGYHGDRNVSNFRNVVFRSGY
jgi:hypothetical protein